MKVGTARLKEETGMTPEEVAYRLQGIFKFSDECRDDIVFAIKAAVVADREVRAGYYPVTVGKAIVVEGDIEFTGHAGRVRK
jgi:hypothetical protein